MKKEFEKTLRGIYDSTSNKIKIKGHGVNATIKLNEIGNNEK